MLKVLFLIPDLRHGGAEKVLVNLVNNMDREKFDITVQTLFDTGVNRQYLQKHIRYMPGFKWQFRGNSHIFCIIPAKWLYKFFVKEKYDVIISYLEGPTTRILSGCTDKSVKRIAWVHIEVSKPKKYFVCFKNIQKALNAYKAFDKVVFVSDTVKQTFEKTVGDKLGNGVVMYNTVETDVIKNKSAEPIDDVVFSKDEINVCSVAKIVHTKGYDRLARIHERLIGEGIKHHIYILGIGEQRFEIENYISSRNLSKSFTFLGYKDNPYKYVKNCDLYVCSSHREGFSTAVTEALVVGTPVVSTCCSGAYELLGYNNEYGIVTENNEEGIYNGLKMMLTDEKLLAHYKKQAEVRGEKFSTENTVNAVSNMIMEICNA